MKNRILGIKEGEPKRKKIIDRARPSIVTYKYIALLVPWSVKIQVREWGAD